MVVTPGCLYYVCLCVLLSVLLIREKDLKRKGSEPSWDHSYSCPWDNLQLPTGSWFMLGHPCYTPLLAAAVLQAVATVVMVMLAVRVVLWVVSTGPGGVLWRR